MKELLGIAVVGIGAYWLYNYMKNNKSTTTTDTTINYTQNIPAQGIYQPVDWGQGMATDLGYGQEPFILNSGFDGFTYPRKATI
ncbi:MAG TPA: hypothetical protein VN026_09680 [Bacteroidia bacterium]|jgi:hypothetical protein|nr:hypothetical protein [Bacteroidia bacterium]